MLFSSRFSLVFCEACNLSLTGEREKQSVFKNKTHKLTHQPCLGPGPEEVSVFLELRHHSAHNHHDHQVGNMGVEAGDVGPGPLAH